MHSKLQTNTLQQAFPLSTRLALRLLGRTRGRLTNRQAFSISPQLVSISDRKQSHSLYTEKEKQDKSQENKILSLHCSVN